MIHHSNRRLGGVANHVTVVVTGKKDAQESTIVT
jgi:hypothetical protein